jgi:hypothetical protein
MAPFEALYGRKCRTPLYWSQTGKSQLFGIDIIKEAERQVQMIRENLRISQSRQKSYADGKRSDVSFQEGDYVYLKASPIRGLRRFKVKGKLSPRFIGPFQILQRVGEVAYRLDLPEQLSDVHDVFHISQLKGVSNLMIKSHCLWMGWMSRKISPLLNDLSESWIH